MTTSFLTQVRAKGGLRAELQPIYELKRHGLTLLAVECLARGPRGSHIERAADLFAYAAVCDSLDELDRACLEAAFTAAGPLPGSPRVAVNVRAATLCAPDFPEYFETLTWGHELPASRLIIELAGLPPEGDGVLAERVATLKHLGAKIAFDDTGLGEIDIEAFVQLRPDYLKLDARLVHGIEKDPSRQAILRAFLSLGERLGFRVAAEGVEDLADLHQVSILGIEIVQGFHFSQPLPATAFRRQESARHDNYWDSRAPA